VITILSTTFPLLLNLTMTKATYERRLAQLIEQVRNHPHREEVLRLAMEQLRDDDCITVQHTA
jgi:hypothetical protein